jgi:hypothetical protein
MGARDKLNWACFNGALLIAGCAGLVTGSWAIFWIALIVALGIGCYDGDIRPTPGRRSKCVLSAAVKKTDAPSAGGRVLQAGWR